MGAHFTALADGRRTFYTAPIKALVSEKFFDLCAAFGPAEGRHDDRRRQRQRGSADHLLHRGGAGEHRAAGRRRRRRGPGGDGRVPLLRRPRPRLGLAGAPARTAPGAVRADVGHPRRHDQVRDRPDLAHRPAYRGDPFGRAPGAAGLLVRHRATARDVEGTAVYESGAGLCRALHPGGRAGAGAGTDERERLQPGREGRHRRHDRQLPVLGRLRQDPVPAGAARHRRAPRRHAAQIPAAGRDADPGRAAQGHLRHRHPRRGHQRADPHRPVHRLVQVRREKDPAAAGARVSPDRRAGGPGRL